MELIGVFISSICYNRNAMNSEAASSIDETSFTTEPQNNETGFRIWIWIVIYTFCYFLVGFFSSAFLGLPFLMLGESIDPRNFFLPFPLRRCSSSLVEPSVCNWNLEYSAMSLVTYLLFLFIFTRLARQEKLNNVKRTLILITFVISPFLLSIPIRFITEFIKSRVHWKTEMAKYYEEETNIPYTESEIKKLQQNVDFSILIPDKMPYGLLFWNSNNYGRNRVELNYEKDLFRITIIQTIDEDYSLNIVLDKNKSLQSEYDMAIQKLEDRKASMGGDYSYYESDRENIRKIYLDPQAYVEEIGTEGICFAAKQEGTNKWRPYVYFEKDGIYLVIRMESYMSTDPKEDTEEKEKLVNIAKAFLGGED